jgi:hypothetical protein
MPSSISTSLPGGARVDPAPGWVERVAAAGDRTRVATRAPVLVEPCLLDGKPALVYEPGLEASRPRLFDYLERLARRNGLQLLRNRRRRYVSADRDRRRRI